MPAAELRLRPAYVAAFATAASNIVNARSPVAAATSLAEEATKKPVTPHGWSAVRRPDGSLWYICVQRDEHGFEVSGRSGPKPPPDVDPAAIPVTQAPDGGPLLAGRLAEALRLVRFCRNGSGTALLGPALSGVADGDIPSETRLAALFRLERARATAKAGHAAEYVGSFLSALGAAAPEPTNLADVAPIRDLAAYFARDVARERDDMTLDARSAGLVELFTTAVAEADDQGARYLTTALLIGLPMARGDVTSLLDHVMMLCRKWSPPWLETTAKRVRSRAEALIDSARDATDPAAFAHGLAASCHASWLADAVFGHIEQHAHAAPGLRADPLFAKLETNTDELLVRTTRSAMNWHWSFRDGAFARHRLEVVRRMRAGGPGAGTDWAIELIENYFYYPRCLLPLLSAPDPGGPVDGTPPAIAVEAHAGFLCTLGLAA